MPLLIIYLEGGFDLVEMVQYRSKNGELSTTNGTGDPRTEKSAWQ